MRQEIIHKLQNFRTSLHRLFIKRADALFNLLDALSRDGHQFKSVVELSQSVSFERSYNSITDGITRGLLHTDFKKKRSDWYLTTQGLRKVSRIYFLLIALQIRALAKVMQERELYIHQIQRLEINLFVLVINTLYWQCHQKESEARKDVG